MATPVQVAHNSTSAATSVTVTLSSTTAGNTLIACIYSGAASISSVKSGTNVENWASRTLLNTATIGPVAIWSDPSCGGGATSVVVTQASSQPMGVFVYEFPGVWTFDVAAAGGSVVETSKNFSSGSSGTLSTTSDLLIGMVAGYNASAAAMTITTAPASPWVNQTEVTWLTYTFLYTSYMNATATTAQTYSGVLSAAAASCDDTALLAAFTGGVTSFSGSPSAPLALGSSAAVVRKQTGAPTGALALGASVAAHQRQAGAPSAPLALGASAAGSVGGSGVFSGSPSAALALGASVAGKKRGVGTSTAPLALTGSVTRSRKQTATSTAPLSLGASVVGSVPSSSTPSWDTGGTYTLEFSDEFTSALDSTVWTQGWQALSGTSGPINEASSTANAGIDGEAAAYTSSNVSVSGGLLNLALTHTSLTSDGVTYPYSGSCITTNPTTLGAGKGYQFQYGAIEARIWLPSATVGSSPVIANWPAFWTDCQTWPAGGEIDIVEGLGGTAQWHCWSTPNDPGIGGPAPDQGEGTTGVPYTSAYGGSWHTYGVNWTSTQLDFYYDGVFVGTLKEGIPAAPHYIILNNTTGWQSGPEAAGTVQVDWVRQWSAGPTHSVPSFSTLRDSFATDDMQTVWYASFDVGITGSQAAIPCNNDYTGILSTGSVYNLTGTQVSAKVTNPVANAETGFTLTDLTQGGTGANLNSIDWSYDGTDLTATLTQAGTQTTIYTVAYSATTHAYLRVREVSGSLFWDTSSDGSTWTNRGSHTYTMDITGLWFQVWTGYDVSGSSTTFVDNVNADLPGAPSSFTGASTAPLTLGASVVVARRQSGTPTAPLTLGASEAGGPPGSFFAGAPVAALSLSASVIGAPVHPVPSAIVQPNIQILVDWTNSPIGADAIAGTNFVDISDFARLDLGVNMSRGRQDNISSVQPSRCTFTVDNSGGRFTPGKSSSPYYPGVLLGRRVQVNVADETGVFNTRFDGMINEIDVNDTATGHDTTATFICTDVLAYLSRYPGMSCWTVEYSEFVGPLMVQYVLNEPSRSLGVSDAQGNGPVLPLYYYDSPQKAVSNTGDYTASASTATFASGNSPVEAAVEPTTRNAAVDLMGSAFTSPLQSVQFASTVSTTGTGNAPWGASAQFQGPLPQNVTVKSGNAYTILCWVWPDVTTNNIYNLAFNQEIVTLGNTRTGQMLGVEYNSAGTVDTFGAYKASYYSNFLVYNSSGTSTNSLGPDLWTVGPLMVAVTISGTTAKITVGGNLFGLGSTLLSSTTNVTIPSGTVFNNLTIGGGLGGGNGFIGNISNVCLYSEALSSPQLSALSRYGAWGPSTAAGGAAGNDLLGMAGVPSYWSGVIDSGGLLADYFDLTGSSPTATLDTLQSGELGIYFVDAQGRLNYHSRDRRMGAPAPAITLPPGSYNQGIAPKWNDQYLVNSTAVQGERGGVPVVAQNDESVAAYGLYPDGSLQSPTTLPLFPWYSNVFIRQVTFPDVWETQQAYDNTGLQDIADWETNTSSQPGMKLATIMVDMLGSQPGQNEYVAPSVLYAAEIDTCIAIGENLPWWPNATEASELFVEGVNETYSTSEASISFYTSPAYTDRAWVPGDATYGQLDVSARLGVYDFNPDNPNSIQSISTFAAGMNNSDGGATSNGYVSAKDARGIWSNLQLQMQPPLMFTQQTLNAQSIPNNANTFIVWDGTMLDTVNAMNQYTNGAEACIIWQEGWYEIYTTVQFAANSTGNRRIYIIQNQTFALRQVAPVEMRSTGSGVSALTASATIYCALGDAIAVMVKHDAGTALNTSVSNGGSHLSLRYLGSGTFNRN